MTTKAGIGTKVSQLEAHLLAGRDVFQAVKMSVTPKVIETDLISAVAFVDIDLNGDSGLECAKILTELNPKLKVIFATAHSEYMANAFEIYAFDYLVKPFNVERVVKTLNRIQGEREKNVSSEKEKVVTQSEQHSGKLMIKGKEQVLFVDKKDIIFVERSDSATSIFTKDEVYKTSASLGSIEEKLSPKEFMRCHKSYIINISMISKIEPYGRWTYIVKFKGIGESALMTAKNYEEIKKMWLSEKVNSTCKLKFYTED